MSQTPDFDKLIPDRTAWNSGRGVDPETWVSSVGNYQLAVGYSLIFWPRFVVFEDYVLRESRFTVENLRSWEKATDNKRGAIEAVLNHIHIQDLHDADASEDQLRYLGRVLRQIHEVKLRADFPDRRFEVVFDDTPGQHPLDYEMTFYQA